jgi:hypothetical protein
MAGFQITVPGFYRQRNGGKAEVFAERGGRWYGMTCGEYAPPQTWKADGSHTGGFDYQSLCLIAVWRDEPKFKAGDRVRVSDRAGCGSGDRWQCGRVLETRADEFPIRVELEDGSIDWWKENALEEAPWTPTNRLRWHGCEMNVTGAVLVRIQDSSRPPFHLEQLWICGDREDWRPVEVA